MAVFTKAQLISDVILRVTKGKPSDDLELEFSQVAFWIDELLPALVQNMLNTKIAAKQPIDPSYIKIEECVKPKLKRKDCVDCQNNIYIELECPPMDLLRDMGVIRVATEDGQWADKVTLLELDNLTKLRFSKPSIKNIKYHRVKDCLYLHGITSNTYHLFDFNIAYVPKQEVSSLNDTDPIYVSDEILAPLSEELEKIARRQLYQSDIDEQNNGRQDLNINQQ